MNTVPSYCHCAGCGAPLDYDWTFRAWAAEDGFHCPRADVVGNRVQASDHHHHPLLEVLDGK